MRIRTCDPAEDREALLRLWREIGWIERDDRDDAEALGHFLAAGRALVAEIDGAPECLACTCDGALSHLGRDVPLSIVSAVTTSLIARKRGCASRVTARAVADDALAGRPLAVLGMFEQGYYSRLGFGNGPYGHIARFSPERLTVTRRAGVAERLSKKDYRDVHQALTARQRGHGGVLVSPPEHVLAEMVWTEKPMGLGYRDGGGALSHFVWGSLKDEQGPFEISAMAWRGREQLLELLALLKGLGDQILLVEMHEPAQLQLQDLLAAPFRGWSRTEGGRYAEHIRAEAYWQARINDVPACLAATRLPGRPPLDFNLRLDDPIRPFLDPEHGWRGAGGDYTIRLGERCAAETGHAAGLPLLEAAVGGFTRLWLGAASANAIAGAGEIDGEQSLLDRLERTLSLPRPVVGWEF